MAVWQIQLLGGLRAARGNSVIAQFPSRPTAMLLARLALEPQRRHSREELIELLWPGVELDVGRNRLRQVLSTLRRLLEPPDVAPYSARLVLREPGMRPQAESRERDTGPGFRCDQPGLRNSLLITSANPAGLAAGT